MAMTTNNQSFFQSANELNAVVNSECTHWVTRVVNVQVATSLTNDETESINLMDTLGNPLSNGNHEHKHKYWMTSEFSQNTLAFRKDTLIPFFVRACHAQGFGIMSKGWEARRCKVVFICKRGRCHIKPRTKEANNNATPSDSSNDENVEQPVIFTKQFERVHKT